VIEIKVNSKILLDKLNGHDIIKNDLVSLIEKSSGDQLYGQDKYDDYIEKLDHSNSKSPEREWVKYLLPYLQTHFEKCTLNLGFEEYNIKDLWFQQYKKDGRHGWHIHSQNYTGIYYLELPESAPSTELVDPFNLNNKFNIPAKEGDIVIFPSFVIHRSSKVLENIRKTIVSFNIEFDKVSKNILERL
jgi:hypothetical protein|tara:strand:+ start:55 stop:618 length:564 start_codon:yes stop_codon:yes gene_type:complete